MRHLQWSDWSRWHGLEKADLAEVREELAYAAQRVGRNHAFVEQLITYIESLQFEEFNKQLNNPARVQTGLQALDSLLADLRRLLVEKT